MWDMAGPQRGAAASQTAGFYGRQDGNGDFIPEGGAPLFNSQPPSRCNRFSTRPPGPGTRLLPGLLLQVAGLVGPVVRPPQIRVVRVALARQPLRLDGVRDLRAHLSQQAQGLRQQLLGVVLGVGGGDGGSLFAEQPWQLHPSESRRPRPLAPPSPKALAGPQGPVPALDSAPPRSLDRIDWLANLQFWAVTPDDLPASPGTVA